MKICARFTITLVLLLPPAIAGARDFYPAAFELAYPTSLSDDNVLNGTGVTCQLCHATTAGGDNWNSYGWSMRLLVVGGATFEQAMVAVEGQNADGDPTGASNLAEIMAGSQPGWTPGPNNTTYEVDEGFIDVFPGQLPPAAIAGTLDPPPSVPTAGARGLVVLGALLLIGLAWVSRRRTTRLLDLTS